MFAQSEEYFTTNPRGTSNHALARSPDKFPLWGHVPIRKFFAKAAESCIYLRRAPCTRIIYFSPVVTQRRHSEGWRLLAISPSDNDDGECTVVVEFVTYSARPVHGIASWPAFAKEHSPNFDNHSKFLPHRSYVHF